MALKHVLVKNPRLKGWEYGMLRALEKEIVEQTQATVAEVPWYGMDAVTKRVGHGMRWQPARRLLPKKSFEPEGDVLWYILMGPENNELDLFKAWYHKAKYRIVYLYDTLEPQFTLIKHLFSNDLFNIRITSFNDAVPYLEQLTGNKWHVVEQAVPASLFTYVPPQNKLIDFSSYGRRFPDFHNALLEFCRSNRLYYDYTTHDARHPTAPEEELYRQYAWHLSHSKFTVSWPVELTNPRRAGRLHPITCRWFEAASAGTVVIGKQPDNPLFNQMLDEKLVTAIDPFGNKGSIWKKLDQIYADKEALLHQAHAIQQANAHRWTWKNRVSKMLELLD